jgi:hypothetical protein
MKSLTFGQLLDVIGRAHSVIVESDGADEHAELLAELATIRNFIRTEIDGSHMGTGADVVVLERSDEPPTSVDVMRKVLDELDTFGLPARIEFPGCIVLIDGDDDHEEWWFGTANDVWSGDLQRGETVHETLKTCVPSTSQDAKEIADGIVKALVGRRAARG